MQLSIMLFFQSIRTPLVEKAAEVASMFGEIAIPLLVEIILLWCFSRKKAFALASSLLSALLASQTLKAIFRVPRPFQVHPDLIEGGRLSTATGYSFPSGHSTTSGACYSSIAMIAWKRWATVICLVPIILVPISRLVLGVHWPSDVAAGTAIGVLFGCALTPLMLRLYDRRRPFLIFTFAFGMASTVLAIVLAFLIADELMRSGIDHQQLAGTKPVLANDMLFRDRQHTGLGRQDDMTVVCLPPAQRAQPIAVKRRAQLDAIAEQHRGRAIPWLHQRRVIMIEVFQLARQRSMLPRMRDERGHRLLDRHAVEI